MSATPEVARPSTKKSVVRVIKLLISSAYYLWMRLRRLFSKNEAGTCVVLYYHSVPAKYTDAFEQQMRMLADRGSAIDVARLANLPSDCHSVVVTFDDALKSFAENAVPVLQKLSVPATVFVVTDVLGTKPPWGEGYYLNDEQVMSQEQLHNLPDLITVGSHTLTHPNLMCLAGQQAYREIELPRVKLEAMLHHPVFLFSFPHGGANQSLVRLCQKAGYKLVFTTEPVLLSRNSAGYVIGRVSCDPWDWKLEFFLKMSGAYCWQVYTQTIVRLLKGKRRVAQTVEVDQPSVTQPSA
jgi:peptidoglycan/xylan/chitin deacetylase (PgdA/CDA1 family)